MIKKLRIQNLTFPLKLSLLAILYGLLVRVSLVYLTANDTASILWLPSGLSLAVLLILGRRYIASIFIGTLVAYLFDHSILSALGLALGASFEALLALLVLNRSARLGRDFNSIVENLHLILLAGLISTIVGAFVGAGTLLLSGLISEQAYLTTLCRWWMGDALGMMILTPFILVWQTTPKIWRQPKQLIEMLLLLALAFGIGQIAFMGVLDSVIGSFSKGYLMFMFITLVALRSGMHGTLTVIFMAAIQGLVGAMHGVGYFADDIATTQLLNYWFYMVALSFVGVLLSAFITAEQRDKESLQDQERFFRLITDNIDDLIAVLDLDGKRLYNSPSYAKLFGDPRNLLLTDSFAEVHPDDRERVKQVFRETVQTGIGQRIEYRFLLQDGSIRYMESRGGVIRNVDGELRCIAVVSHDITERKETDEKIYALAYYDPLTHLPNRLMLKDRFNLAMAASKRSGKYSALMVLDLDNFKPINDQYGHTAGDLLLMEASRRIASSLREIDTVARFGGDEFVVILTGLDIDKSQSEALALAVAEKIRLKVAEPYIISTKTEAGDALEIEHHCTSSIGIALFFGSAASQEDVFKWADMAMYMAKEAGRNQIKVHID